MVRGLPPTGTALARSAHGTAAGDWTSTDELLRQLTNVAQEHAWAFFELHRDRGKQKQPTARPEPIQSPFEKAKQDGAARTPAGKRIATAAETLAILSGALG